jgi:squalene-hopene/tetraprenyl-beta-curcumene cyclase
MAFDAKTRRRFLIEGTTSCGALLLLGRSPSALARHDDTLRDDVATLARRGAAFLRLRQEENGGWSTARNEPGITALVVTALLKAKAATASEPVITKGLAYLERFVRREGGLEGAHANYSTSIALMAFQEANSGGRYDAIIKGGQSFLKTMQWDESEGKDPSDPYYGGAGYGGRNNRPDLSNTAFMIEALRESGLPADDPALQKALRFVSRCQNLKSEFNDQPWAGKVNDGGFVYTAAQGGQSIAGEAEGGGLRSYGSMTYAGFKSLVYAGLTKDDPRVKAALDFIRQNYTLEENPGMGQSGLYYYYQAFAKAMNALGEPRFTDAQGTSHDWRAELTAALAKRQAADGSWVNTADRFMEGDPNLVTAFALIALANTRVARLA